jgi:branched-chain amino acid transport system permease protein
MAEIDRRNPVLAAVLTGLALVSPFILYPVFVMEALCFALFSCAFNLLIGYVGLLSFGHAAFFGSAAYITAHTVKEWGLPPELGIFAGAAVAALLGMTVGWLAIRRQGIYFAMITLALAQMVYFVALQARFTGGEDGIQAVPREAFRGSRSQRHPDDVLFCAGRLSDRLCGHRQNGPFAFRPDHQGDPRERAARRIARL